jgi:hypothetical protein
MNFCIISPAAGLEKWSRLSRRHLVLSHVRNAVYRNFYRQRREEGDLVILDNGAYEGYLNEKELLEAIEWYHPQVVILPDILLGDAKESFERGYAFWKEWRHRVDVEWMYVPQAPPEQVNHFFKYLHEGLDKIQPKWLGVPRALATDIGVGSRIRADVCQYVKHAYPGTYVHALGMVAGDLEDLKHLSEAGCDSIDSSAPVWRGWRGYDIEDPSWHELGSECDFNAAPLDWMGRHKMYERLIKTNLLKCGVKA